ncbi:MAG: UDP-N-acetylglucosamine 1-carboxyvinyltransferase [Chloroflexi bacterium]|nr:UDP-N-acetylglucosamine 1-carboxyvinyltransferase [Chloroflexota bacterium]
MRIQVEGGHPLNGTYQPGGNSNAAIALLAAACLTHEPVTLHNLPRSLATATMRRAADNLGVEIAENDAHSLTLRAAPITRRVLTAEDMNGFIGVLLFLAPMLMQRQHARLEVDFPLNRIRTHLEALRDLGIDVVIGSGAVECKANVWEQRDILLAQASVTATALALMLAARLGRETIIRNAACEPHIQELAHLLNAMGAQVSGIGSNVLHVVGAPELQGAEATIGPDHVEVASVAALGALCGGRLQIEGIRRADLLMVARIFGRLGIQLDMDEQVLYVPKHGDLSVSNREEDVDSSIETAPWPGFPSDLVALATLAATQSRGTALIHEKLFDNRLLFVDKLKAMGAQIVLCDPHRALVVGPTPLQAIYMDTPDVRAGLGMLGAALVAQGKSVIDNAQAIERNFEGVLGKLQALGAQIVIE